MFNINFIGAICGLVCIGGCAANVASSPLGPPLNLAAFLENQTTYETLNYIGVSEYVEATRIITFELTNPRNNPICIRKRKRIGYFGEIDYFNAQGQSYRQNTPTVPGLLSELDAITSESILQFVIVPPGETIQITREIFRDMFPHGSGLFTDNGPFYSQLKVSSTFECTAESVSGGLTPYLASRAMEEGNFVFLSGKVGPFYLQ